jgi:hypothetical protein
MAEKKKVFELSDLLKILGALAVFIPLVTGVIQYRQSVRQELDKNFQSIVENLSSQDREKRLAAAANMGTFIKKGSYWPYVFTKSGGENTDNAIDILINRLSTELDYNVLNAIKGSLLKMDKEGYKKNIEKILGINRNMFIQNYAIDTWKKDSQKEYYEKEKLYKDLVLMGKKEDRVVLDNIKEEMEIKKGIYFDREKDYLELKMHKQVTADFISVIFLEVKKEVTKKSPIEELDFYQNSLNNALIIGLNLNKSKFEKSALSASTIEDTKFDNSTIIDTVFTRSDFDLPPFSRTHS